MVMIARSKLNSVETLIYQALIDLEITHEEYKSIINEEENYKKLKENIRITKSDNEKDELNNKNIKRSSGNVKNYKKE